ncbi:MAG: hypothetical protein ACKO96_27740, partial [Flammeovirgaceae bacterium]
LLQKHKRWLPLSQHKMIHLGKGLLLEDLDILIEWGPPVDKSISIREDENGDRTIYHWGQHKILSGLESELSQTFMYGDNVAPDKFTSFNTMRLETA